MVGVVENPQCRSCGVLGYVVELSCLLQIVRWIFRRDHIQCHFGRRDVEEQSHQCWGREIVWVCDFVGSELVVAFEGHDSPHL